MADVMTFPDDWHDFLQSYSFDDSEEIYTNGSRLIPVFRVEQLIEHLLKAQEPHVLTLEEACGRDACFYEYRVTGYVEPASVVMSGLLLNGKVPLVDVYRLGQEGPEYVTMKDYGHEWRCWDKEPTNEQRKVTLWTQTNGL